MGRFVVHLKRDPFDVRIDRQTMWGNPFVIGKDGTREQVIAKYRAWIMGESHMVAHARLVLRGKCECGASYYRAEDIGKPCEIQYCRGIIKATA